MLEFMARSRRLSYLIGLLILVGGTVLGALKLNSMPNKDGYYLAYLAPGRHQVELQGRKTYKLYWETHTVMDGRVLRNDSLPEGFVIELRDASGTPILINQDVEAQEFNIGHRAGLIYGEFRVPTGGVYTLEGRHADGAASPVVLTIQTGDMRIDMAVGVFGMILSIMGGGMFMAITSWAAYRYGNARFA